MNFNRILVLCFGLVLWSDSCGVSFPRGGAQAQDCIPIIEGKAQIISLTSYGQSGDIFQLGLYLEVAKAPDNLASFHILLDIPPNHLKTEAIRDAWEKKRTLFIKYLDKICAKQKYDEILSVSVQTPEEMKDLTAIFVKRR